MSDALFALAGSDDASEPAAFGLDAAVMRTSADERPNLFQGWQNELEVASWRPTDEEKAAAWELSVEVATRCLVADLGSALGLREELDSLHALVETTRHLLRKYGPALIPSSSADDPSLGQVAVFVVNQVLRPALSKWHPIRLGYEGAPGAPAYDVSLEEKLDELRDDVAGVHAILEDYGRLLAEIADAEALFTTDAMHPAG